VSRGEEREPSARVDGVEAELLSGSRLRTAPPGWDLRQLDLIERGHGRRGELAVLSDTLLLTPTGRLLHVLTEDRVHQEGQVEGRRCEVAREENRVDGTPHLVDLGVSVARLGG
jgi:hypothetical protein